MLNYIAKNKGILVVAAIVLASFLWMTSQVRQPGGPSLLERGVNSAVYPFVKAIDAVTDTVKETWTGYFYLVGLVKENERLREKADKLASENVKLREEIARGSRLEKLMLLREKTQYPAVPAHVVGRDVSSWFKSIWVDAGESDGVRKNMPAAVDAGLVGKVLKAYGGTSRILLITDPDSAVSCMLARSRDTGILAGAGAGLCRLQYVGMHADVAAGDLVVASGLDGVYPKGMPVGVVVKATKSGTGYFQEVRVRPAADLAHLEELMIIKYEPPKVIPEAPPAAVKKGGAGRP